MLNHHSLLTIYWIYKYKVRPLPPRGIHSCVTQALFSPSRWQGSAMFTSSSVSPRPSSLWPSLTISGPAWRQSSSATSTRRTQCPCPTWMRESPTPQNKPPKTWAPSPTPKATCTKASPPPSLLTLRNLPVVPTHHHTHPESPCTSCTCPPHPLVYKPMVFLF